MKVSGWHDDHAVASFTRLLQSPCGQCCTPVACAACDGMVRCGVASPSPCMHNPLLGDIADKVVAGHGGGNNTIWITHKVVAGYGGGYDIIWL